MSFQVAGGTESLLANVALVGLLPCVHQVVFLKVGELGEIFPTDRAFKRPLACVNP